MKQRAAFEATLKKIKDKNVMMDQFPTLTDATIEHLETMLFKIREADLTGNRFSTSKVGRWLGYAQGVAVANGWLTLSECKEINEKHA